MCDWRSAHKVCQGLRLSTTCLVLPGCGIYGCTSRITVNMHRFVQSLSLSVLRHFYLQKANPEIAGCDGKSLQQKHASTCSYRHLQ